MPDIENKTLPDLLSKDVFVIPTVSSLMPEILDFSQMADTGGATPEVNALRRQTFYQNDAPTDDYKKGDIWIDTNDSNHPYRASDLLVWTSIRDTAYTGRAVIYYQATAPASGMSANDYWIDSDDNMIYRYSGSAWVEVQDNDIAQALTDAFNAQTTANTKIVTFTQASAPTASETGDLWLDSDDGNKMYRWSGSAWVSVQDSGIATAIANAATAQATADGKIITFVQTTAPTAEATGDLWADSDDGYNLYRWSGTAWIDIQDGAIASALTAANNAQSTADGKIVSFFVATAPTAEAVGDIWFDTDDNNKPYRWSGSAWVAAEFDVADWAKIFGAGKAADNATVGADWTTNLTNIPSGIYQLFFNTTTPGTGMVTGDYWIDSDDNKIYRYSGAVWVEIQDDAIGTALSNAATAQGTADTKILTYIQTTAPTASETGDLWLDSDDANRPYRWSGAAWVQVQNNVLTDAVVNNSSLSNESWFGDGSDGAHTTAGDETLTADVFYTNLTITSGDTIFTNGYRIFVSGTLTYSSADSINCSGGNGGNGAVGSAGGGAGGSAGAATASGSVVGGMAGKAGGNGGTSGGSGGDDGNNGTDVAKSLGSAGVAGGNGGGASANAGGTAGSKTGTVFNEPRNGITAYLLFDTLPSGDYLKSSAGGGSGAGGDGNGGTLQGGGGGGGSGAGGGIITIFARIIVSTGTILAKGGNGGNGGQGEGTTPTWGGGGGGGGAGSGGIVIRVYSSLTDSGSVDVSGGTGGTHGNGYGTTATDGSNGNAGLSIDIQV